MKIRASMRVVLTIYDAARCPYCARVRILLAEKGIEHELVPIDLDNRPSFIRELNPPHGRVPVLEEGAFVLPESPVIMEYLEERYPEPALLPADAAERARARLTIFRFDDVGGPYYDLYRGRPAGSHERLAGALGVLELQLGGTPYLAGWTYSLADIAYFPWILRAETRLGFDFRAFPAISDWRDRLLERPAAAREHEIVLAL
jgi:glutathione S-transferase